MMGPLTLAYSPCPNDTYIFAALANGWLSDAPVVDVTLADVEALNRAALDGKYDVSKVSYAILPELNSHYRLLRSGGALGYNCGPLVVARPGKARTLDDLRQATIAIPGVWTTAYLLLRMALQPQGTMKEMRFDRIASAVATGAADAGLIIHEARFTFQNSGLIQIADLGEWWGRETELPLPLGAIVARRDLPSERLAQVENAIRSSLQFAYRHDEQVLDYVRRSTNETDEVIRKHIALYVNDFSDDLGSDGEVAVEALLTRGGQLKRLTAPFA